MLKYLSASLLSVMGCSACANSKEVISDQPLKEAKVYACIYKDDKLYCMEFLSFMKMLQEREAEKSEKPGIWEQEKSPK